MKRPACIVLFLIGLNLFSQNKAKPVEVNGYAITMMIPDFESADSIQEFTLNMKKHELGSLRFKKSELDTNTYWISFEIEKGLTQTDSALMESTSGFMGWDYRHEFKYVSVDDPGFTLKTGVYLFTFRKNGEVRRYRLKAKMKAPEKYKGKDYF